MAHPALTGRYYVFPYAMGPSAFLPQLLHNSHPLMFVAWDVVEGADQSIAEAVGARSEYMTGLPHIIFQKMRIRILLCTCVPLVC